MTTNAPIEEISLGPVSRITVAGYKSIAQEQSIELRPLTILAGANSSGKSSMLQPLLLIKQTLDSSYDPGALWLGGPNVKFTSATEFLSRFDHSRTNRFKFGFDFGERVSVSLEFSRDPKGLRVTRLVYRSDLENSTAITLETPESEVLRIVPEKVRTRLNAYVEEFRTRVQAESPNRAEALTGLWLITRNRCFLVPGITPAVLVEGKKVALQQMTCPPFLVHR